LGVLVACLSWQAQAACTLFDGFKDNKDGTVTDPRNGLIWKRCAEGFVWNGNACQGGNKDTSWFDAMEIAKQSRFLGKTDWRIPTRLELESVLGRAADCSHNDYRNGQYAASANIAHSVSEQQFPGVFWSSSPKGSSDAVWTYNFANGSDGYGSERSWRRGNTRLVRSSQSLDGKIAVEFNNEYKRVLAYNREQAAKLEAQERREAAERESSGSNSSQSRGGVKDIYRFENGSLRVACNNGNAEVIQKMDTGGWYFNGRVYKEISLLTSAACP
jgi:Protein of unknown function (DUF1566)